MSNWSIIQPYILILTARSSCFYNNMIRAQSGVKQMKTSASPVRMTIGDNMNAHLRTRPLSDEEHENSGNRRFYA
jgi:hypothetical protein